MSNNIIKGNTDLAVAFLDRWYDEELWPLTAIYPDGVTETKTFSRAEKEQAHAWIDSIQGIKNIYFTVNPVGRRLNNKASKEDITRLTCLHVDIDPPKIKGIDIEQEQKKMLKQLENYTPAPSVIIYSGGGYQAFWRLNKSEKLETGGNLSRIEELESYNRQLSVVFKADHCHNADRIMRVPGTVNIPSKLKRNLGRKEVVSDLVYYKNFTYDIETFVQAVNIQTNEKGLSRGKTKLKISGNIPVVGCDELTDWARNNNISIPEHTLAVIATGQDPIDPLKYSSRSEALFAVCCSLVKCGVPDDMIFAVITGPNEIATSVLDKGRKWESYALRQIERAKEEAIDPVLREFNEKHAVISDIGGKCRIISETFDPGFKRTRISKQSFEDFKNRYRNIKVKVGVDAKQNPVFKPAGLFWVDHPQRRQYESIVFAPGKEISESYNLWRGFAYDAIPGNKHEVFLKHTKDVICSGNEEYYRYLIGWMARAVQQPDTQGEVAVVLRGKRGTGKGKFVKIFGSLFGRHFIQIVNSKHLVGQFNAHLRDTVVLFADEAFYAGDKQHESILKALVTEETIMLEGKGLDAESGPNYVHLISSSNEEWVVPAGEDERRYFVLDVSNIHKQDISYFAELSDIMSDGGMENFLYFLMTYDLSEFEVRHVPQTRALQEQKILTMTAEVQWWFDKLRESRVFVGDNCWKTTFQKESLYEDYIIDMDKQRRQRRLGKVAFGKLLSKILPPGYPKSHQKYIDSPVKSESGFLIPRRVNVYFYTIPDIIECRKRFDDEFGGPFEWPEISIQDEILEDTPF